MELNADGTIKLTRRTTESKADWLMEQIGILFARIGNLERNMDMESQIDRILLMIQGLQNCIEPIIKRLEKLESSALLDTVPASDVAENGQEPQLLLDGVPWRPGTPLTPPAAMPCESAPPQRSTPSEPALPSTTEQDLERSCARIAEAVSLRQGTPLPERYKDTTA